MIKRMAYLRDREEIMIKRMAYAWSSLVCGYTSYLCLVASTMPGKETAPFLGLSGLFAVASADTARRALKANKPKRKKCEKCKCENSETYCS